MATSSPRVEHMVERRCTWSPEAHRRLSTPAIWSSRPEKRRRAGACNASPVSGSLERDLRPARASWTQGIAGSRRAQGGDPPSLPPLFPRDLPHTAAAATGCPAASHGPSLVGVPPPRRKRIQGTRPTDPSPVLGTAMRTTNPLQYKSLILP
jgi:hypothetical protein